MLAKGDVPIAEKEMREVDVHITSGVVEQDMLDHNTHQEGNETECGYSRRTKSSREKLGKVPGFMQRLWENSIKRKQEVFPEM